MSYGSAMAHFGFDEDREQTRIEAEAERLADAHQAVIDDLASRYRGRPVEEITPVLAARWHEVARGSLDAAELAEWSRWLSQGESIMIVASNPF